jgi:hypothetical protein
MNVIKVMGGLGNQIFQYAFGKALGDSCYDVSWYDHPQTHPRPYRLDKFADVNIGHFLSQDTIHENGFDISLLKKKNCNFEGYWQRLPYYSKVLGDLKKELWLKEQFYTKEFISLKNEIQGCDSVSVHVRRGDYVFQGGFHDLPFRYYMEGLSILKGEIFIFSDDIPWCKEKFKPSYFNNKITFVDMEDYLSFELMRVSKKKVIANSTFSYWAALLSDSEVVTPREWLGDRPEREGEILYYPVNWIKIQGNVV